MGNLRRVKADGHLVWHITRSMGRKVEMLRHRGFALPTSLRRYTRLGYYASAGRKSVPGLSPERAMGFFLEGRIR